MRRRFGDHPPMADPAPSNPSLNEADLLKIREQARAAGYTTSSSAASAYVSQVHAERLWSMNGLKEYGQATVRLISLLNGGTILSLLTFIGNLLTRTEYKQSFGQFVGTVVSSFYFFGGGLVCATLVSGLAYVNYSLVSDSYQTPAGLYLWTHGKGEVVDRPWLRKTIFATVWIPVSLVVIGLGCFVVGSVLVAQAFTATVN